MLTLNARPMIRDVISCDGRDFRVSAIAYPVVVATCVTIPPGREPKSVDDLKIFTIES